MNITWIYLLLLVIIIPLVTLYFINQRKQKETIIEPNFIHIFPDYPRRNPCIREIGEIISFIVKGYKDSECMEEIELKKEDIVWQHQNYVGEFVKKAANEVDYQIPEDEEKVGKIIYISATYHKLKDATWIKISI